MTNLHVLSAPLLALGASLALGVGVVLWSNRQASFFFHFLIIFSEIGEIHLECIMQTLRVCKRLAVTSCSLLSAIAGVPSACGLTCVCTAVLVQSGNFSSVAA